jgi:hypothetical protein
MSTQDLGETFTLDTSILNLTQEIKEVPCTIGDIEKAVGILNNIITSTPAYTPNYKIFTEEELKRLLEHTYEHIFTILEENKIITK